VTTAPRRARKGFVPSGHLPGAKHLPRGLIELNCDKALPDPSARILTYGNFGKISTLAAATLRATAPLSATPLRSDVKCRLLRSNLARSCPPLWRRPRTRRFVVAT
jgi:hypothetical protein